LKKRMVRGPRHIAARDEEPPIFDENAMSEVVALLQLDTQATDDMEQNSECIVQ